MGLIKNTFIKIIGGIIRRKMDLKEDSEMDDSKKWWQSKTILLGLVMALINIYEALAPALVPFGVSLPPIPGIGITVLNAILGGGIIYTRNIATKIIK